VPFPKKLLNQNEELVLDLRPHWLFLALSSLALLAAIIVGLLAVAWWNPDGFVGDAVNITMGGLVLVTLVWFGATYAKWATTMFVLTTDRILTRRGVISKQGVEIPLDRVNTVFFQQGILERMVGAGDLSVESAGERGTESFRHIRKPSIVQKEIYVQMEANENRKFDRMKGASGGAPAADATTPQPASIPDQIDQLSELHQRGVLSDAEFARKKAELLDRM
jgi:uncharacterized membrane protein YdbT with pleckstrin-like domain